MYTRIYIYIHMVFWRVSILTMDKILLGSFGDLPMSCLICNTQRATPLEHLKFNEEHLYSWWNPIFFMLKIMLNHIDSEGSPQPQLCNGKPQASLGRRWGVCCCCAARPGKFSGKHVEEWRKKWEHGGSSEKWETHIYIYIHIYIFIYTCIYNIHIYVYIHVYTINEVVSISSTQCFSMGLKLPPMLKHTSMEDASGETWPLVSLTPPFSWRHNTTFVCISLVHVDLSDPSQFYMISFHISYII